MWNEAREMPNAGSNILLPLVAALCILSSCLTAEQIAVTLQSGRTVQGERILFEDGQFFLFQTGKVAPVIVDFSDFADLSFSSPASEPEPYVLPRFIHSLNEEEIQKTERAILSGEVPGGLGTRDKAGGSRTLIVRCAQIANHHISHDSLKKVVSEYRKQTKREGPPSTADRQTWVLYLICLNRLGPDETLDAELKVFSDRYSSFVGFDRVLERISNGSMFAKPFHRRED